MVWILILGLVVFLFGGSKIPQFARALGQARKEFDHGWNGVTAETSSSVSPPVQTFATSTTQPLDSVVDPLIKAAQNAGIDTNGKSREQIAQELSLKLNGK
jgi:TatA/E family protein of Tat protein translocase